MPPPDPETARWFAEHLQVHEPYLRSWLRSRFAQIADLDDIIQDAYIRVLRARAKGEIRQPKAFFFATARNLAYDYYHKYQLKPLEPLSELDDFPVLDESADIAEVVSRNQELELMTQAIQSLPDRCRQVLTLRNVYGLSYKEIAAQLGMAVKTVEAHLANGLRRCVEFVEQYRDP